MPKYANPWKTWRYSTESKAQAGKISISPDIQIKQVSEGLVIQPSMLSNHLCYPALCQESRRKGIRRSQPVYLAWLGLAWLGLGRRVEG
jgi:hypothetical protein